MPLNVCMNFKLPSLFSYLPDHKLLWFFFSSVQPVPSWINIYLVPDHTKEQWRATTTQNPQQQQQQHRRGVRTRHTLVVRLSCCLDMYFYYLLCIYWYLSSPGCVCTFCSKYAAGAAVLQAGTVAAALQQRRDPARQLGRGTGWPFNCSGLWIICR